MTEKEAMVESIIPTEKDRYSFDENISFPFFSFSLSKSQLSDTQQIRSTWS